MQQRAFTYIHDIIPVMATCISRPDAYNQVFNIGSDKPYTVRELAERVSDAMGVTLTVKTLPERMEVKHAYASHAKLYEVFGDMMGHTSLDIGLQGMANWVKKMGCRSGESFSGIEVYKNMPMSWQQVLESSSQS
jgi:UDP-glucose 4-epimerase